MKVVFIRAKGHEIGHLGVSVTSFMITLECIFFSITFLHGPVKPSNKYDTLVDVVFCFRFMLLEMGVYVALGDETIYCFSLARLLLGGRRNYVYSQKEYIKRLTIDDDKPYVLVWSNEGVDYRAVGWFKRWTSCTGNSWTMRAYEARRWEKRDIAEKYRVPIVTLRVANKREVKNTEDAVKFYLRHVVIKVNGYDEYVFD